MNTKKIKLLIFFLGMNFHMIFCMDDTDSSMNLSQELKRVDQQLVSHRENLTKLSNEKEELINVCRELEELLKQGEMLEKRKTEIQQESERTSDLLREFSNAKAEAIKAKEEVEANTKNAAANQAAENIITILKDIEQEYYEKKDEKKIKTGFRLWRQLKSKNLIDSLFKEVSKYYLM